MKGRPVDQIVYEHMFPRHKANDPQNFHALLQRSLIPEVRQETHAFYGHLETHEAKYPGLDYTHPTHRIRLSRWPWHRRLFRAFDSLRLTGAEIAGLTKWEGTKWAKEKFEKEQGVAIRDTAADGFPDWSDIEHAPRHSDRALAHERLQEFEELENEEMEVESEDELESVGVELNERLRAQAARREAGDTSAVLDEEWELWLKNAIETGELGLLNEQLSRGTTSSTIVPAALFPPGLLSSARAGRWHEIPESFHSVLRRTLDSEDPNWTSNFQQSEQGVDLRSVTPTSSLRRRFMENPGRVRVPWPSRPISDLRFHASQGDPTSGSLFETFPSV